MRALWMELTRTGLKTLCLLDYFSCCVCNLSGASPEYMIFCLWITLTQVVKTT